MAMTEIEEHISAIEQIIQNASEQMEDNRQLDNVKQQIRSVRKSIRDLEKVGIPVPEEMHHLRDNLLKEKESLQSPINGLVAMYSRALKIVVRLGEMCGRSPRRDLYHLAKAKRAKALGEETLRNTLIKVLEEMGGKGHEKTIFTRMQVALQSKFSVADLESPRGKTPRWQSNVRSVRKRLIREGILTPESRKRNWSLAV